MRQAKLGDFLAQRSRGIVPASTPEETFELYSVPAFEGKRPEVVAGGQIGSNKQIVDPGTVLLCKINPRINRAWVVGSFTKHQKIASTEWITFPPHPEVEARYLAHYLSRKEIRDYLAANASGVGGSLMRVKASTVEDLPLPLPDVDEQRRVVAELEKQFSRLDEAVASLKRVKAQLRRYEDAVLCASIGASLAGIDSSSPVPVRSSSDDELEAIAARAAPTRVRRDVPTFVNPSPAATRIHVPAGWTLKSVADLLRHGALVDVKDGNHGTNHPKASEFSATGIPFITATEVRDFQIDYVGAKRVSGAPLDRLKVGFAQPNDVILTHKGTVGRTAVNAVRCVLSPQTTYYRIHPEAFVPKYLQFYFASPQFRRQLADVKSQTTRDYVPISDQYRLFVLRPPLAVQVAIVAEVERRLSIVYEIERVVAGKIDHATMLRAASLTHAFLGTKAA